MNIIYALESPENVLDWDNSIYLAGPTHRIKDNQTIFLESWRTEAIRHFKKLDFNGLLIIPEWKDNIKPKDWTYEKQIEWEDNAMQSSTVIMFWIPRYVNEGVLALTTNVEFGEYLYSGKITAGAPEDSDNNRYLRTKCEVYLDMPWHLDLRDLCKYTVKKLEYINGK
jgi:hypothetical protein